MLVYIFYRSEIVFDGEFRQNYKRYVFISTLFLFFSIFSFFLNNKIRLNIFIIFFFTYISILVVELILIKFDNNENKYKYSKINFYENKILDDPNYRIFLPPKYFININYDFKDLNFFPLSLNRNKKIIVCNENDFWLVQNTDLFGFINKNKDWDEQIDAVFLGDSYAQGQCVRNNENLKSLFEKKDLNILNLAIGGNGPLATNAIYREYAPKNVETIIWFFYEGNDLNDLKKEKQNVYLKEYFNDYSFTFNLKKKNKQISNFLESFHENSVLKVQAQQLKWNENIFKLNKVRNMLNKVINYSNFFSDQQLYEGELTDFFKIFELLYFDIKNNNQKLYFIYLPEYARYSNNKNNDIRDKFRIQIENFITKNFPNVEYIDIHNEIFSKIQNNLKLFSRPGRNYGGHYSAEGYKLVSEFIIGKINETP